jgi:hypothetical protein
MKLTLTQQVIMAEIKKSGSITARRVMEITGCVYRDSMDYVYQTLGRMVKAGLIKRTGPGVFGPKGGGHEPRMIWITFCIAWLAVIGWITFCLGDL